MKKIAFPVNDQSGLDGRVSLHFGSSRYFFLVDVDEGTREVKGENYINNVEHTQGGCMMPVRLLANNNADILVVGGIGMRPLSGFLQMGITVMHNGDETRTIRSLVENIDKLPVIDRSTCGGH
ncbi:MAG: NifB/NifX family molybdenum-iron cluster-binding protein [Promethearchaeota archaeon]